jgi:hypothetical protein
MNTIKAPSDIVIKGIQDNIKRLEERLLIVEAQLQSRPPDVGNPFGDYEYEKDMRAPTSKQVAKFRDLFGTPPPQGMPQGHVWLAINLHYNPEREPYVRKDLLDKIRAVAHEVDFQQ